MPSCRSFPIPLSRPSLQLAAFLTKPPCHRTFLNSAFAPPPQRVHESRTLPYPPNDIYNIVADVSRYSKFVPYCKSSVVTRLSAPDAISGKQWPSEATLVVGWGAVEESFTSRVYCAPGSVVEAVAGMSQSRLKPEEIAHHLKDGHDADETNGNSIFRLLSTRWTVEALQNRGMDRTLVTLSIEFAFNNPLYTAMSLPVIPKVASVMIDAFQERVDTLLGDSS
ncbi:hypothetical protein P152DRAFT_390569 [Eremomyces bilateralis CBS 781.70]|uniref:Coenzyme Q-binding protein COQ10 START domain-containing protein n=1 Tax=Eremomyces bilateralis CBS 781.70 TaxID=1392243 RepID=A0A6G1GCT0_9PEZI|nr:uncharacterized protein P152DRAFT_390569 [Eremomyces bilateralis CBS 781.70]KAF1815833.1 hypothetical protein P152DRAFT_390569 [Eremomyces bilateralis CBS 781.70]